MQLVDPERMGRNGQLLREGAEALGVSHHPLARNAGACVELQFLPLRVPARREAGDARLVPAARGCGRRTRALGRRGAPAPLRGRSRDRNRLRRRGRPTWRAGAAPVRGERSARRDRRRRRVRHAGAPHAIRGSFAQRRTGPQPPHPPGVLGGRSLRRRGSRLGRDHAELRRRRVAEPGAAARGHLHAARVRRPLDAGHRRRASGAPRVLRPRRVDRRSPVRPVERAGRDSRATARCASPTG